MTSLIGAAEHIIPFLVVLTLLVFVHELGHYLVARYNKVKVEVFSIGFGPELFGWHDSAGTRWKFSMIPLGGYVRMYGDADSSSRPDAQALKEMSTEDKSLSLHGKSLGQRMAVSAAGPFANFLFAILVLASLFTLKGEPTLPPTIGAIVPGKIAEKVGLKAGDKILKINGTPAKDFPGLRKLIISHKGKDIDVLFVRDGIEQTVHAKMVDRDADGHEKPVGVIGIAPSAHPEWNKVNPAEALMLAFQNTGTICAEALTGIGQMIIGQRSSEELGGILSIGDMAGKSAKGGIASFFFFIAFLSINLGLINLFPIPVLDGGHLLFYGIEGIRGKPVSEKVQEYAFMVGLAIVASIMLISTWNDVVRLFWK